MRVVVVPPVLALLPEYAGREDPVAELRSSAMAAVSWLTEGADGVRVVASDVQADRIGAHLLASAAPGRATSAPRADAPVLVLANGSAKRTEKAPGHLDDRAAAFDDALGAALTTGDTAALAGLDRALAAELWASGIDGLASMRGLTVEEAVVDYADDPYGVAYWVVRWTCSS